VLATPLDQSIPTPLLRLHIVDTRGNKATKEFPLTPIPAGLDVQAQKALMRPNGTIDVTRMPVRPYTAPGTSAG
jgi:hypothetical protein